MKFTLVLFFYLQVSLISVRSVQFWSECSPCKCLITAKETTEAHCEADQTEVLTYIPKTLDPSLKLLYFKGHMIQVLHDSEFAQVGLLKLKLLSLVDCNVYLLLENCFKNLTKLEHINLSSNFIEDLNPTTFINAKKLKIIYVRDNKLRRIYKDTFADLEELEFLDLSSNLISNIEDGTFRNNKALKEVSLDNNLLKFLLPNTFESLTNVRLLSLYDNPWSCDCELLHFLKNVQDFAAKGVLTRFPTCASPPWLAGKNWTSLAPEDLTCKQNIFIDLSPVSFVSDGENVTFSCIVQEYSDSDVHWTYNKKIVDECEGDKQCNETNFVVSRHIKDGVCYINLTVVSASSELSGLYGCVFTNQLKKEEQYVALVVNSSQNIYHNKSEISPTTKVPKYENLAPKYENSGTSNIFLTAVSVIFFIAFVIATITTVIYRRRYLREARQNYPIPQYDDSFPFSNEEINGGCDRISAPTQFRHLETMEFG